MHRESIDSLLLYGAWAQIPLIMALNAFLLGTSASRLFMLATAAGAIAWLAIVLARDTLISRLVLLATLDWQVCLLNFVCAGKGWQVEVNFYFAIVIVAAALYRDRLLLLSGGAIVSLTFVLLSFAMPKALWTEGSNAVHLILHEAIVLFVVVGLAFIHESLRRADEWQGQTAAAIDRLEESRAALADSLSRTSSRADKLDDALTRFRAEVSARLNKLLMTSENLSQTAIGFAAAAAQTSGSTKDAADISRGLDLRVKVIASTSEVFRIAIEEIGSHASISAQMGTEAIEKARATADAIEEFNSMSEDIDRSLQLIGGIARTTNLLALNATIEAARAGEHGRGFAVVAAEVKSLATQTSAAVSLVEKAIAAIRGPAARSASAVTSVAATLEKLNTYAVRIEEEVDKRIRDAQMIATGVHDATRDVNACAAAVGDVRFAADETGQNASFLKLEAEGIASDVAAIQHDLGHFAAALMAS